MAKYIKYSFALIVLLGIIEPAYTVDLIVLKQGEVTLFSLPKEEGLSQVFAHHNGRNTPFFVNGDSFFSLLSADMGAKIGSKEITLTKIYRDESKKGESLFMRVEEAKFGFQEFKAITRTIMTPTLKKKLKIEKKEIDRVLKLFTPKKWEGNFVHPLEYNVAGEFFGFERLINGVKTKPHTGADYATHLGSKIRAINRGKVALVARHYFAGRCVYIDHGMGLVSMYFHMGRAYVQQGDIVEKGQFIGTVGLTGRSSGPHLHLGITLLGDRVDPNILIGIDFG